MNNYKFIKTDIEGVYIIKNKIHIDTRGHFIETYKEDEFIKNIGSIKFVQDNYSVSTLGVLRGLHFQKSKPQGKLIRVIEGSIYDVYVDIRKDSKTFGQWRGVYLSEDNGKQLYIPRGFAHGFLVLHNNTKVSYKCDEYYYPEYDDGIIWNDSVLNINWGVTDPIVSDKDKALGSFKDLIKATKEV